jgi:hypothetical protein
MSTRASMVFPSVLEDHIGFPGNRIARLPGQHLILGRLTQQHAGEKRLIGQMAALLQDIMHGPVFVGGESIQRMVGHSVLGAERCGERMRSDYKRRFSSAA